MRHVLRTLRVDLDWLFERLRDDPSILLRVVVTKEQMADILTKGSSTSVAWSNLLLIMVLGAASARGNATRSETHSLKTAAANAMSERTETWRKGSSKVVKFKTLTVGTDCSGMEGPIHALKALKVPYNHIFSCDCSSAAGQTIWKNSPPPPPPKFM